MTNLFRLKKPAVFLGFLTTLFFATAPANADFFHLFHGHRHANPPVLVMPAPVPQSFSLPPILSGGGSSSTARIEVPRQVIDNLNQADKNLREAKSITESILKNYNPSTSNNASNPGGREKIRSFTDEEWDALFRK